MVSYGYPPHTTQCDRSNGQLFTDNKDRFPNIDDDIQEYLESVLESTCEDMESIEDVYDEIG